MADIKMKAAGSLQEGNYIVIEGAACTVVDVKISRPGKHGHAKANIMAVGMLDGKKRNFVVPGHDHIEVPVIGKRNAQVLSIHGEACNVMDTETYETFDLAIPDDLKGQVAEGQVILYWVILNDRILKSVKSEG